MLNNASFVAKQEEFRYPMVGDVEKHAVGQSLHFALAYGKPVLSRCGCEPDKCITVLSCGDVVRIKNVPKSIRDGYGLRDEVLAKYNGNWLRPGFHVIDDGVVGVDVIEYEEFIRCRDWREVEIYVREICD